MRLKEAARGYCWVSRRGWDDDERRGGTRSSGWDECTAMLQGNATRSDCCSTQKDWTNWKLWVFLRRVAQLQSISSLASVLETCVLKCPNSSGENTSLKAESGTILNNRSVCNPKQKDVCGNEWYGNRNTNLIPFQLQIFFQFIYTVSFKKRKYCFWFYSLVLQQATVTRKSLIPFHRKKPWLGSYGDPLI